MEWNLLTIGLAVYDTSTVLIEAPIVVKRTSFKSEDCGFKPLWRHF
jgi:hypothetical protein